MNCTDCWCPLFVFIHIIYSGVHMSLYDKLYLATKSCSNILLNYKMNYLQIKLEGQVRDRVFFSVFPLSNLTESYSFWLKLWTFATINNFNAICFLNEYIEIQKKCQILSNIEYNRLISLSYSNYRNILKIHDQKSVAFVIDR